MLTFNKVKKALLKVGLNEFEYGDYEDEFPYEYDTVVDVGGDEGGGEYVERVWHFTDKENAEAPGVFIKCTGSYASYGDGTELDEESMVQVFPKKRVVTKYETRAEINEQKKEKEKASV